MPGFSPAGPGVEGRKICLMGDAGNSSAQEGGMGRQRSYSRLAPPEPYPAGVGQRGAKPRLAGVLLGWRDGLGCPSAPPPKTRCLSPPSPTWGVSPQHPDLPPAPGVMLTGAICPPWPWRQSWCWMASVSLCTTRRRAALGVSCGRREPAWGGLSRTVPTAGGGHTGMHGEGPASGASPACLTWQ